jgi:hypothetical protein
VNTKFDDASEFDDASFDELLDIGIAKLWRHGLMKPLVRKDGSPVMRNNRQMWVETRMLKLTAERAAEIRRWRGDGA